MRILAAILAFVCVFYARPAGAVEAKAVRILDTWAVVGVISASNPASSVAVLRNLKTQHTYTLAIGDALPNEFGFALKEIKNRIVVVTGEKTDVTLNFAEASAATAADESDEKTRTARFIDNYYRGLSEAPIEILRGGDDDSDANGRMKFPMRHFGTLREDAARSRFDHYKSDDDDANSGDADGDDVNSEEAFPGGGDPGEVPPAKLPSPEEFAKFLIPGAAAPRSDDAAPRDLLSN